MRIFDVLVAAIWLIFLAIWLVAAFGAKKSTTGAVRQVAMRAVIIVAITLLIRSNPGTANAGLRLSSTHPILGAFGVLLCALGIAFAIWARVHIGKNWGMPMSIKVDPDLVTSGPYAFVRHPIYGGVLVAMLGTALALTLSWLAVLAVFAAYFIVAATREERVMAQRFPTQYPDYRRRTKMLLPFVL
jgi:protein-S-isoprenylcysteine O-methyltransferase Ste14